MNHIMLDLETFGKNPGCVIRSIGALLFDPYSVGYGDSFYANIEHQSCIDAGLQVEKETADWWDKQNQEAKEAFLVDCRPLNVVAETFCSWFRNHRGAKIWCQGAAFDAPIWEHTLKAIGIKAPWAYYDVRDTRTAYDIARFDQRKVPKVGIHHNALDDCKFQVSCVQQAYGRIGPR